MEVSDDGSASVMKDYAPLQTKMAAVNPSSTSMDAYTPTNKPAPCPDTGNSWAVKGDALPPTPNKDLCDCMYKSLACVPSESLQEDDYKKVFDEVCGADGKACDNISRDTVKGVYGQYSMCDAKSQLGYILNEYYKNQNEASDACDWKGSATVVKPTAVDAACKDIVQSASASSKNTAGQVSFERVMSMGEVALGLYVVVAMAVGGVLVL